MNCPTCLEPVLATVPVTNETHRCPTCNNDVRVADAYEASHQTAHQIAHQSAHQHLVAPVSTHAPVPKSVDTTVEKRTAPETPKSTESKFSFRILGSVTLLLTFCLASFLVAGTALTFYLSDVTTEPMLSVRSEFFRALGITQFSEYTQILAATTFGKALVPAILAFIALIAVSRRKQITAIVMLTLLVAIGFVIGSVAPVVPIICLIMVCVPGRSNIWKRKAA